ncbi:MAG: hypothetical protein Q4D29_10180 [Lachnospiraceae bacterium]|nr:hypothetical protein [Lachnospiraceae bacterium]
MAFGQPNYGANPYYQAPNNYQYQPMQQQQQMMQQSYQQPQYSQPQYPTLYGKIVESRNIVDIQEIPIGVSAIYPLADMSKIYIKSYNKDGKTDIEEYQKVVKEKEESQSIININEALTDIYDSLTTLNAKVDGITTVKPSTPSQRRKKEVASDE